VVILVAAAVLARHHLVAGSPAGGVPARGPASAQSASKAQQHYRNGERALLNRNFSKAIEQYQLALDDKENLDGRLRALSHLGIAIAMNRRSQAQQIGREIERRWPGDPDLERIRAEFREGRRRVQ
jgi:hypothetical protein